MQNTDKTMNGNVNNRSRDELRLNLMTMAYEGFLHNFELFTSAKNKFSSWESIPVILAELSAQCADEFLKKYENHEYL